MPSETEKSGMKFVFRKSIFTFVLAMPLFVHAQLDSSYELLLGTHVSSKSAEATTAEKKAPSKKKRKPNNEDVQPNVQEPAVTPTPVSTPVPTPAAKASEEPSISQQATSLFSADTEKVMGFYQTQFDDSDPRQNKVEIGFAPTYVTNESSSNYSYRDYRSVFPGMNLGANVWLTPGLGLGGNFLFSLGGDTSGDAVTNTRSPARYEFLDIAVKFRKFFGFSPLSKSVEFDLLYSDYKFNVPSDDMYRARLKTTGAGIKMTLRVPTSQDVAWLFGGSFFPRLQHSENKTGVDISSGDNVENTRIGFQIGSEVKLSRESQVFYEASVSSEKNLFDGTATLPDPATGASPKNVSVTDTMYMFSMGYRWGN
jgi:hypothetical protein